MAGIRHNVPGVSSCRSFLLKGILVVSRSGIFKNSMMASTDTAPIGLQDQGVSRSFVTALTVVVQ